MSTMTVVEASSMYEKLVTQYGLKGQPGIQLFSDMPEEAHAQLQDCTAVLMAQPSSSPRLWSKKPK